MFGVIQVLANKVRHCRIIQFGSVNRQLVFAVAIEVNRRYLSWRGTAAIICR